MLILARMDDEEGYLEMEERKIYILFFVSWILFWVPDFDGNGCSWRLGPKPTLARQRDTRRCSDEWAPLLLLLSQSALPFHPPLF